MAVYEPQSGQLRIVAVGRQGLQLGVKPGLTVSAAMVLAESLEFLERSVIAERAALESLAAWSHALTPNVSLQVPEGLLLEVRGSLKLFGGLDEIKSAIAAELRRRGLGFRCSVAPTPLGALWLARCMDTDALTADDLASRLAKLPLSATGWPERTRDLLHEMGLRTIGDCLRLPRGGLARRAGRFCLDDLDRALGRKPDLRRTFERPRMLEWSVDFSGESADRSVLIHAIEAGIERIAADLRRHQAAIGKVEIVLPHLRGAPTRSHVEFVEATHERQQILSPLLVRLEKIELREPVIGLGLCTGALMPMRGEHPHLFSCPADARSQSVSELALIESMRARFGMQGIHGLELRADHRPELAWERLIERLGQAGATEAETVSEWSPSPWKDGNRPLWILPLPLRLPKDGQGGAGKLTERFAVQTGPERIESGWWDGRDVRRDYFVATTMSGQQLWIYRDCTTQEWYLHGVFG